MHLDTYASTLVSTHPLTPRVKQYLLRVDGHTFDYRPGQHTGIAYEADDGSTVHRTYTPVSRPGTDTLALAIKRYDEGTCSVWMDERSVGDTVPITDLSGNLHLRDPERDALFLSTGTGITPMLAMLKQYLDAGTGQAVFVHGERRQQDLMYRETLDHLSADHARLTVQYVLSREDWAGRTGYVQEHLEDALQPLDVGATDAFVCGVPAMVVETETALTEHGVDAGRIFTEGWEQGAAS